MIFLCHRAAYGHELGVEILGSKEQLQARRAHKLTRAGQVRRKQMKTALEDGLNDAKALWLIQHCKSRWESLHGALNAYREERERAEKQMREDFSWRLHRESRHSDVSETIFEKNNDTLNIVGSFRDFLAAQAKNDIFGAKPWFSVKPEGRSDAELSEKLQRHFSYKLKTNNLEDTYLEAIDLAAGLGEAFIKTTWRTETDTFERAVMVLHSKGKPVVLPTGEYIYSTDEIIDERLQPPGDDLEVEVSPAEPRIFAAKSQEFDLPVDGTFEMLYEEATTVIEDGLEAKCLYYRDVAFDPTAPELDLTHTDFFAQFTLGLQDAKAQYQLTAEQYETLRSTAADGDEDVEANRPRTSIDEAVESEDYYDEHGRANIPIHLVEGFVRCDPFGDGRLRRLYLVFNPASEMILFADYLSNVTPGGSLPVSVHKIYPVSGRLYGCGMFERYAYMQEYSDDLFNQISWRNRCHSNPIIAYSPHALEEEEENAKFTFEPGKTWKLKEGVKMEEAIQMAQLPDLDTRTMELLQMSIQFGQMRTGITSASQGEMSSLPQNNTATGVQAMMSRAAVLLKEPIDSLKKSLTRDLRYAVKLTYARFDRIEAFVHGEGEAQELIELSPEEVANLELDVRLLMTQAQNSEKLENSQAAIQLLTQYMQFPEHEKAAGRDLFLQALKSLNFDNADQIIREAVTDPQQLLEILPAELQGPFAQFMQSMQPEEPPQQ